MVIIWLVFLIVVFGLGTAIFQKDDSLMAIAVILGISVFSFSIAKFFDSGWGAVAFAIPMGVIIAFLGKDELAAGKKWFLILAGVSVVVALIAKYLGYYSMIQGLLIVLIVSGSSVLRWATKKNMRSKV